VAKRRCRRRVHGARYPLDRGREREATGDIRPGPGEQAGNERDPRNRAGEKQPCQRSLDGSMVAVGSRSGQSLEWGIGKRRRNRDHGVWGRLSRTVSSFRLKLVAYFALLSLLPAGAAFWGFATVSGQNESHRVDARLEDDLRETLASAQQRVDLAQAIAERLAGKRSIQIALDRRDRGALARALGGTPDVYVTAGGGWHVGPRPGLAARRPVEVVTQRGQIGTVVGFVALDEPVLASLRNSAGLPSTDALVVLEQGRIVAAQPSLKGRVDLRPAGAATLAVGGVRYRALVAPALPGTGAHLAVVVRQSLIDAAVTASRERILLGLLACLALVSAVALLEGRSIVRTLRTLAKAAHGIAQGRLGERVPVRGRDEFAQLGLAFNEMARQLEERRRELEAERARVREATGRFGEALAVTHDRDQLLRVIVGGTAEAAGARGARLRSSTGVVVEVGDLDRPGERLELALTVAGETLGVLALVGDGFDDEQRMSAASLVTHAAIALENVRLHELVERQALVDVLTSLANRRAGEQALHAEIARSDRLGTPLALVLADLDDFKAVNDAYGHSVGDELLRTVASVLRDTIREADLAGRWGGEEFVLLLPGTDVDGAVRLAERIRAELATRTVAASGGGRVGVTCSFGVAQHEPGIDARTLVAAADQALYDAKRAGKNRVEPAGSRRAAAGDRL
jgi:diguanylate cyclase (GGDEF)-like protein